MAKRAFATGERFENLKNKTKWRSTCGWFGRSGIRVAAVVE